MYLLKLVTFAILFYVGNCENFTSNVEGSGSIDVVLNETEIKTFQEGLTGKNVNETSLDVDKVEPKGNASETLVDNSHSSDIKEFQNNTDQNRNDSKILLRAINLPLKSIMGGGDKSGSNKGGGVLEQGGNVLAGKVMSKVNDTFSFKNIWKQALKTFGGAKMLYSAIPDFIKDPLKELFFGELNKGFDHVNRIIDQKEHNKVVESINFLNNILIPLIELMSHVKDKAVFDCW